MGQIWVMTEALANQIAAGEVVERPASCIKELVENSLDAGAKNIYVAIEEGGITSITVQDDGGGMDAEDAVLAFARHATSKIRHAHDLFRIQTLGFRGEALASIAAVAKIDMMTRTQTVEHGIRVRGQGGELVSEPEPAGIPTGTRIEVRDLFFNTPARLKYLRSVTTEQARCIEAVQKAALSRPDVAFRMDVNDHVAFQTSGNGKALDVLAALYGIGEARQLLAVQAENADYQVLGWIGRPTQGRASRNYGNLFINGRPVRNLALHQAVVAGYQGRLMINRHPMYTFYLNMDPTLVDVNIHPHKAEVRFSEEKDIARLVQQSVTQTLEQAFLVPSVQLGARQKTPDEGEQGQLRLPESVPGRAREVSVSYRDRAAEPSHPNAVPYRPKPTIKETKMLLESALGTAQSEAATTAFPETESRANDPATNPEGLSATGDGPQQEDGTFPRVNLSKLRLIGQALGVYIIADDGESLYVIDQHAAHERVLYERFTERMEAADVYPLALLAPIALTLTPTEREVLETLREEFRVLGLEFEEFGGQDVVLRTIPDIWEGLDAAALVEEMIQNLQQDARQPDVRARLREVVVLRACKAAIKANHRLSMMEMEALCQALPALKDPFHCPHGRPVFIRLTNHDLEKEFRRIV